MHVQGNNVVENRDNECLVLVDVPKSTGYAILLKAFVCQNFNLPYSVVLDVC